MFETQKPKQRESLQDDQKLPEMDALVGFFELLMTVDRRINPQEYD
jgi:hypothetical protein